MTEAELFAKWSERHLPAWEQREGVRATAAKKYAAVVAANRVGARSTVSTSRMIKFSANRTRDQEARAQVRAEIDALLEGAAS